MQQTQSSGAPFQTPFRLDVTLYNSACGVKRYSYVFRSFAERYVRLSGRLFADASLGPLREGSFAELDVGRGRNTSYSFADQIPWQVLELFEADAYSVSCRSSPKFRGTIAHAHCLRCRNASAVDRHQVK